VFLQKHRVQIEYTLEDLERDRKTHRQHDCKRKRLSLTQLR